MTFRQALAKKFGPRSILGKLLGPNLYARIWHIFEIYVREYERGLSEEERKKFRRVFGE